MKKYMLAFLFCLSGNTISNNVSANYIIDPGPPTAAFKYLTNLKVSEFVRLSPKDYSKVTGKKMTLGERISFSIMKVRMKHALKKNPDMKVSEYIVQNKKLSTGWWIVIGLLILLIIVAIVVVASIGNAVGETSDAAASSCGFGRGG